MYYLSVSKLDHDYIKYSYLNHINANHNNQILTSKTCIKHLHLKKFN